jgi:hypothetical protein
MSRSYPSFFGVLFGIAGSLAVGAVLTEIGVPASGAFALAIASVVIVWLLWANFTSPSRPAARQVYEQDVHRMQSMKMTPEEIARDTHLAPYQVRQILAGDEDWWVRT